jgi:hypothetical protein
MLAKKKVIIKKYENEKKMNFQVRFQKIKK